MTAGWVAATVRSRSLLERLVGSAAARDLAATVSWADARSALGGTIYGATLPPDADRQTSARHAIDSTAWQLRVLSGWLPPGHGSLARLFAAPLEIANIEGRLAVLNGGVSARPVRLGSLAVAWPRIAAAASPDEIRSVLRSSVWGEPGTSDPVALAVSLRMAWARRLVRQVPAAATWAKGAAAVLVAREQFGFGRPVRAPTGRVADDVLGRHWREATDIGSLVDRLPKTAAWPFVETTTVDDLWLAEIAVVRRVEVDATRFAASGRHTKTALTGVMALVLVDLWRVLAAIEVAGRRPIPEEVFDAVA